MCLDLIAASATKRFLVFYCTVQSATHFPFSAR